MTISAKASSRWRPLAASVLRYGSHLGIAVLAALPWLFVLSGTYTGDPVKELIHYYGMGALRLLLLTLLISPLASWLSFGQLNRLRRPLGLWSAAWASTHLVLWLWLEEAWDIGLIVSEIGHRWYILLGMVGWAVLVVLSLTSLPKLIKRMGKQWKVLHGAIYPVSIVVCIHFWLSLKSGWIEPAIYTGMALVLLLVRKQKVSRWVKSLSIRAA